MENFLFGNIWKLFYLEMFGKICLLLVSISWGILYYFKKSIMLFGKIFGLFELGLKRVIYFNLLAKVVLISFFFYNRIAQASEDAHCISSMLPMARSFKRTLGKVLWWPVHEMTLSKEWDCGEAISEPENKAKMWRVTFADRNWFH